MVGGGNLPRPAKYRLPSGVLFLDELPEFDRDVLRALREPIETGRGRPRVPHDKCNSLPAFSSSRQ